MSGYAARYRFRHDVVEDGVSHDDLRLFVQARVEMEDAALALLVRAFRGPRSVRSLRRVEDLIENLTANCSNPPVALPDVREALQLA